jgi:transcriptional regulator with XRE-family HTH domain
MVLLRHLLGDVLRRLRLRQGRTLREVSASARVSLGYLSEVERGQKEASSELLSAICTALETPLSHVLREVSDNFALAELQSTPVLSGPREPALHPHPGRTATLGARPVPVLQTRQDPVLGSVRLGPARRELPVEEPGLVTEDTAFEDAAFEDTARRRPGDVTDMVPV